MERIRRTGLAELLGRVIATTGTRELGAQEVGPSTGTAVAVTAIGIPTAGPTLDPSRAASPSRPVRVAQLAAALALLLGHARGLPRLGTGAPAPVALRTQIAAGTQRAISSSGGNTRVWALDVARQLALPCDPLAACD